MVGGFLILLDTGLWGGRKGYSRNTLKGKGRDGRSHHLEAVDIRG